MKSEIESLRNENCRLKSSLHKSESIRRKLLLNSNLKDNKFGVKDAWQKLARSKRTRALGITDDEKAALLFNFSNCPDSLVALDAELAGLNHASRDGVEHPVSIISENELRMVSYPKNEHVGVLLNKINEDIHDNSNFIGHVVVPQHWVEITAGFAGVKGNLVWFNTGDTSLMLSLRLEKVTRSILLNRGFGFVSGKEKN